MITRICTKCGEEKELSGFHKSGCNKIGRKPICKKCALIERKKYYKEHKKETAIATTKWNKEHPERRREISRNSAKKNYNKDKQAKWRRENPEKAKIIANKHQKKYRKNNREKSNIIRKRVLNRRKRNFGYIPLNNKFPGSVGHHISKDLVIFIPEELHKSVPHRYNDPTSMGEINGLALEFMMPEVG